MKKAIFWDSDGTLLYGNESFKCSLMRVFEEFGYILEEDDARNFMRSVCSWYIPERDHSDKNGEEWWQELLGEIRVFCEGHEVCESDIVPICNSFREKVITFEYEAYSDAKEVLHLIGDNPMADYQGGLDAGMRPILVHNMQSGKVCCEQLTDLLEKIIE